MSDVNDLIRRLRGEYRIPITDGLGAAGGDEPKNPNEFVRTFEVPPINKEAAALIEQQAARIAELERHPYHYIGRDGKTVLARDLEDRAEALSAKVAEQDSEIVGLRGLLRRSRKEVRDDEIRILWNIAQDAKARAETAERELAAAKKEAGFLRAALRVNAMRAGATSEEIDALLEKAKEHGEQKDGGNE